MTHTEAAAALEDARFDARQDSRHEDLANDERGPAELAEWARITQLLAGTDDVYDPQGDIVVQAELAADAAAAAAREAELREATRIAARADELQALRELGALEQTGPRHGDEAVRDELTRRAGGYVQGDVDAWLAHALAAHLGHYRDPAARESAAGLLPAPVLAHAALLTELARLVPGVGQLAFVARLAQADPGRHRPARRRPRPRPGRRRREPGLSNGQDVAAARREVTRSNLPGSQAACELGG